MPPTSTWGSRARFTTIPFPDGPRFWPHRALFLSELLRELAGRPAGCHQPRGGGSVPSDLAHETLTGWPRPGCGTGSAWRSCAEGRRGTWRRRSARPGGAPASRCTPSASALPTASCGRGGGGAGRVRRPIRGPAGTGVRARHPAARPSASARALHPRGHRGAQRPTPLSAAAAGPRYGFRWGARGALDRLAGGAAGHRPRAEPPEPIPPRGDEPAR